MKQYEFRMKKMDGLVEVIKAAAAVLTSRFQPAVCSFYVQVVVAACDAAACCLPSPGHKEPYHIYIARKL